MYIKLLYLTAVFVILSASAQGETYKDGYSIKDVFLNTNKNKAVAEARGGDKHVEDDIIHHHTTVQVYKGKPYVEEVVHVQPQYQQVYHVQEAPVHHGHYMHHHHAYPTPQCVVGPEWEKRSFDEDTTEDDGDEEENDEEEGFDSNSDNLSDSTRQTNSHRYQAFDDFSSPSEYNDDFGYGDSGLPESDHLYSQNKRRRNKIRDENETEEPIEVVDEGDGQEITGSGYDSGTVTGTGTGTGTKTKTETITQTGTGAGFEYRKNKNKHKHKKKKNKHKGEKYYKKHKSKKPDINCIIVYKNHHIHKIKRKEPEKPVNWISTLSKLVHLVGHPHHGHHYSHHHGHHDHHDHYGHHGHHSVHNVYEKHRKRRSATYMNFARKLSQST